MIDLSKLPPPDLLDTLDYEAIYQAKLERFKALCPAWSAALESDPVVKLLELSAYDELLMRARINDVALSRLLAFAAGADLDHAVALLGVSRLVLDPGDADALPPRPPVYEPDDRLRMRGQMALEGMSVAGPVGAYVFHALSASALVSDVSVDAPRFARVDVSPAVAAQLPAGAMVLVCTHAAGLPDSIPGDVAVTVLASSDEADVYAGLLPTVSAHLSSDTIRPLTDHPHVVAGRAVAFEVRATLHCETGPDPEIAVEAARKSLADLLSASRKLGAEVPRSALFAALHVPGVRRVELLSPPDDVRCSLMEYPLCSRVQVERAA
ncbi:baseplate J/gp47 family protein [Laribacter hongkongensis]|uniref:baseplate assembly protein n=1 Tax=Laribacter hongkongensis TaxID=168471 RepID=UPI001EFE179A|nr:baseplate J/gp47 family protein [Laribacter hongkongensis]MCG9105633.1 baseplate J/gp47 family protein [Laribacter hongkongensis]